MTDGPPFEAYTFVSASVRITASGCDISPRIAQHPLFGRSRQARRGFAQAHLSVSCSCVRGDQSSLSRRSGVDPLCRRSLRALRRQHLVRVGGGRRPLAGDLRHGDRPAPVRRADRRLPDQRSGRAQRSLRCVPRRRPADPSALGPHPGPAVLRPARQPRGDPRGVRPRPGGGPARRGVHRASCARRTSRSAPISWLGTVSFHDAADDDFAINGAKVRSRWVRHTSPTLGFRVEVEGVSVAYLSDHGPGCSDDARRLRATRRARVV